MKPDPELVRKWFAYDPETGLLTRKLKHRENIPDELNPSRERVDFMGTRYRVTHIIWVIYYGKWPDEFIDHIDHDHSNNRIINLREADRSQNMWNRKEQNPLGKGVTMKAGRYHAQIQVNGVKKHLGDYNTAEEAAYAYRQASIQFHGEFACHE